MKDAIEKVITDYESKISDCDKVLKNDLSSLRAARRKNDFGQVECLRHGRAIENAKRQAYVQAVVDIDSLLDVLCEKAEG